MAPALIGGAEPIFDNPFSVFKEGLSQGPFSAPRGSHISMWSALRWVQAVTSIGRIGLKSLVMEPVLDVRFGSKADIRRGDYDVRFTPESGHKSG